MRYFEAMQAARVGGVVRCAGKTVRHLTREEAEPVLLEQMPGRRYKKNSLEIEEHAPEDFHLPHLGLFDVSGEPVEFRPSDEEMAAEDWEIGEMAAPSMADTQPISMDVLAEAVKNSKDE
jgi:hypothetical protein